MFRGNVNLFEAPLSPYLVIFLALVGTYFNLFI
jgi:hypothetical protein